MIQEVKVENFRGIERLQVKELRRVNLVTGKNDCGKTTLLEAIRAAWCGSIVSVQTGRPPESEVSDFDGYWRPIFRGGDADRGLLIELLNDGQPIRLRIQKGRKTATLAKGAVLTERVGWTLLQHWESGGVPQEAPITYRPGNELELPSSPNPGSESLAWTLGGPKLSARGLKLFSQLKQAGRDTVVVELLRQMNDDIRGIDLLAPTGKDASLFVRLASSTPMLPIVMMGEGTQRCLKIALALATEGIAMVCLDEIETGLHHSTIDKLWRWLATVSTERNVQLFLTTHSEECIQAAAHVFTELSDDGLCVIRLDRHAHETTAALYDKSLVEATEPALRAPSG